MKKISILCFVIVVFSVGIVHSEPSKSDTKTESFQSEMNQPVLLFDFGIYRTEKSQSQIKEDLKFKEYIGSKETTENVESSKSLESKSEIDFNEDFNEDFNDYLKNNDFVRIRMKYSDEIEYNILNIICIKNNIYNGNLVKKILRLFKTRDEIDSKIIKSLFIRKDKERTMELQNSKNELFEKDNLKEISNKSGSPLNLVTKIIYDYELWETISGDDKLGYRNLDEKPDNRIISMICLQHNISNKTFVKEISDLCQTRNQFIFHGSLGRLPNGEMMDESKVGQYEQFKLDNLKDLSEGFEVPLQVISSILYDYEIHYIVKNNKRKRG